ncbi:thyrotropin releasing hormone [Ambystoma mexicanum]|uniref:thyrotropin releasing hormone n=1 Tax=Ambystoma mexicanum TaxID=8296 RepID=UPI0037E882E8
MAASGLALLLLCLTLAHTTGTLGQSLPGEGRDQTDHHLDGVLQRAESIIIRSILKKMEEEEESAPGLKASPVDWLSKRQHPGKRSQMDMEKRQHPGKREDTDEPQYIDAQKRQHPGKREEDDADIYTDFQKRQHPGRRSVGEPDLDYPVTQLSYINEFTKRQHPGKRSPGYNKRQHPGKRSWEEEPDEEEAQELEKRQHPGKRYIESGIPGDVTPCDGQDSSNCSKASLLLELLDNVNKSRGEEKRQHPGRRSAWEGEIPTQE